MKNKTKKISCMLVVVCILATMFVGLSVSVQAEPSDLKKLKDFGVYTLRNHYAGQGTFGQNAGYMGATITHTGVAFGVTGSSNYGYNPYSGYGYSNFIIEKFYGSYRIKLDSMSIDYYLRCDSNRNVTLEPYNENNGDDFLFDIKYTTSGYGFCILPKSFQGNSYLAVNNSIQLYIADYPTTGYPYDAWYITEVDNYSGTYYIKSVLGTYLNIDGSLSAGIDPDKIMTLERTTDWGLHCSLYLITIPSSTTYPSYLFGDFGTIAFPNDTGSLSAVYNMPIRPSATETYKIFFWDIIYKDGVYKIYNYANPDSFLTITYANFNDTSLTSGIGISDWILEPA